ncbi:MAG: hypothetical protein GY768_00205 [Planctomycetaceae bacterium]|nr:hypothetical protein [Planctomycetaceae bacterium]
MKRSITHNSRIRKQIKSRQLSVESLETRALLAADLIISEFMASNRGTLNDDDRESSDWIEIFNQGAETQQLEGWHLTDDSAELEKWTFPAASLGPQEHLIVFASGKDRTAKELHTNFRLSSGGDFLSLVEPDGQTIASQYSPEFPEQQTDISYGVRMSGGDRFLVAPTSTAQFLVPQDASLGLDWTQPDFAPDGSWVTDAQAGIGFEVNSGFAADIQTDVGAQMAGVNASIYVRIPFEVDDPEQLDVLKLRAKFDDGFIAYLNGNIISAENAPFFGAYNSVAESERSNAAAVEFVEFDLARSIRHLQEGTNVLALQGINIQPSDDDFLLVPELVTEGFDVFLDETGFFSNPTPGELNPSRFSLAPSILNVSHEPAQPTATDSLLVTAQVDRTVNEISEVKLVYRAMYRDEVSISMVDDGSGADAIAADGIYTATIPAATAQVGEMLRYAILAIDSEDDQSRSPRILDSSGTDRSEEYYGTVVGPTIESDLPVFQWFAERESRARGRSGSRASVYYQGEFYDNIFVRQRGGATNGNSQKFNFNEDHPFFVNDKLGRVLEFNMNAQGSDPSYLRQVMAFESYRDAGNPAAESFLMLMRVNGGRDRVGVFIEQADQDYLARQGFDPDGAIYKFVQRSNLNPVFSDTTTGVEKKTRLDEGKEDIQVVVDGLSKGSNQDRSLSVFDNFNLATLMNYLAVRSITMDADDVRKNFYLYRDTEGTGQWTPLPWDKDWTFGIEGDGGPELSHPFFGDEIHRKPNANQWNRLYEAVFTHPVLSQMYLRRLRTVMDQLLQPPGTSDQDGRYEQRINELLKTARSELSSSAVRQADSIRNFLDERRTTLYLDHSIDKLITSEIKLLVPEFSEASYFVPGDDSLGTHWTKVDFDDSQWSRGTTGIGFSGDDDFDGLIRTEVSLKEASDDGTSVYLRLPFNVDDPASVAALTLQMKYDDGFVAYLNGTEVHRQNTRVAGTQSYNSKARSHRDSAAVVFENFTISGFLNKLQPGENILAIQAMNSSHTSSDMLMLPVLIDGVIADDSAAGVPHEQIGNAPLAFGTVVHNPTSGNQDEEYIEITNPLDTAVDISGWKVRGGVEYTFRPGTVIPAEASLFVSPNVKSFLARTAGPRGGQGLVVHGNYQGHLSNFGEIVELVAADDSVIASTTTPAAPTDAQRYLRLSEIHYHPVGVAEATEFVELVNISESITLNLAGVTITDGPSEPYEFTENQLLAPGEHRVVARDVAAFTAAYPGIDATGPYVGSLDNGGERIKIADANGSTILEFEYSDNALWPQRSDGAGASLELVDPVNTSVDQLGKASAWQGSAEFGGSPGSNGSASARVVINEILSNTDRVGELDTIELLNRTPEPVDLSGWWLSDSANNLTKYQLPPNSVLAAGEYLVLTEQQFNQDPESGFALNGSEGDEVWLTIADANGNPKTFVDDVQFGPARPNETFGRVPNGVGRLTPMAQASFGASNQAARVGPVVISELNYNPGDFPAGLLEIDPSLNQGDLEYIEIYNPTNAAIDLNSWRLRGEVDFNFDSSLNLAAGQAILVVSFNPEKLGNGSKTTAFRSHYGLDESVVIVGGYAGQLSDGGERIQLQRPDGNIAPINYFFEDEVTYDDSAPWPASADGLGDSLQRIATSDFGNAASSWQADRPNPGRVDIRSADLNLDGAVDAADIQTFCVGLSIGNLEFDFDGDGDVDLDDEAEYIEGIYGTAFGDANLDGVFNSGDLVVVFQAGEYEDGIILNSTWSEGDWNCDSEFDSQDFVVAFAAGGYESESVPAATRSLNLSEISATRIKQPSRSAPAAIPKTTRNSLLRSTHPQMAVDLHDAAFASSLFDDGELSWQDLEQVDEREKQVDELFNSALQTKQI